jgi:hypothetical protein
MQGKIIMLKNYNSPYKCKREGNLLYHPLPAKNGDFRTQRVKTKFIFPLHKPYSIPFLPPFEKKSSKF